MSKNQEPNHEEIIQTTSVKFINWIIERLLLKHFSHKLPQLHQSVQIYQDKLKSVQYVNKSFRLAFLYFSSDPHKMSIASNKGFTINNC